ncbi:putative membrane protein YqjE [Paraburkholderia sp. RAU6.4a]
MSGAPATRADRREPRRSPSAGAHAPARPSRATPTAMTTETHSQRAERSPLRRILSSVFAILQTRLELVGIELAEEKDRLLGVLFLGLAATMLATMALIALTALVAITFWDTYRWQALAGITAVYAIAGLACALKARSGLRNAPMIFEATIAEFEKDREAFRSRD